MLMEKALRPFAIFPLIRLLRNDGNTSKRWRPPMPFTIKISRLSRTGQPSEISAIRSRWVVKSKKCNEKSHVGLPGGASAFLVSVIPDSFHRESILAEGT